ncbi:hypothetical protein F2Q70_00001268 [Brassica cretica]|uniref:C2 domain-containing protein n=1 Tax=Brassica cretica TaxID=69181 RepID=A0A8S9IRS5_BRACR|nr:hypothetical protein F2Q70_00001268 [Brassica cretica]KAF3578648.1 hypothetical protein DY000_02029965 [Brassica cretica]
MLSTKIQNQRPCQARGLQQHSHGKASRLNQGTGNTKMYQVRVWSNYERRETKWVNGGDHHPLFGETLTFNDNQTDVFTVTSLKLQLVKARVPQLVGVNVMPTEFEPSEQVVGVGEVTISGKSEETVVEVLVENRVVTGRVRVIILTK